ncbi:MAG: hypothetical protein NTY04_04020 [Candidatus Staskawiczbacteria bacterium]|nr:hypothetical protein [Candidatus Staskawiczbacteria bacterium]
MDNIQQNKDNIFLKSAISVGKFVVFVILAILFLNMFLATNQIQVAIGLFILVFITLPTIFIFFFKQKFLVKHPKFIKVWKIYRVFYAIFIILYITGFAFGTWHLNEVEKTKSAVDFINSKKITLNDVMGKNLPPVPDQKLNDSTIAGIDANKNYIRDDVELAIFKEYPNSAKIRAAELQYAQEVQQELTNIYNNGTWIAVSKKGDRAISCLVDISFSVYSSNYDQIIKSGEWIKAVDSLTLNNDIRKNKRKEIEKYETNYSADNGQCDVEIK